MADASKIAERYIAAASSPWSQPRSYKPSEAEKMLQEAYFSLHSFKADFDSMEEIPSGYLPVYNQLMVALDFVQKATTEIYQLKMMSRKLPR